MLNGLKKGSLRRRKYLRDIPGVGSEEMIDLRRAIGIMLSQEQVSNIKQQFIQPIEKNSFLEKTLNLQRAI